MVNANSIARATFGRLARGICKKNGFKIRMDALKILQIASEGLIVDIFRAAHKVCIHAQRTTVKNSDMQCVIDIARTLRIELIRGDLLKAYVQSEDPFKPPGLNSDDEKSD